MTGLARLALEEFGDAGAPAASDPAVVEERLALARGEAHAAGYAAGSEAASAAAATRERAVLAAIREAADDLAMSRAAVRAEAFDALGPLATALLDAVAPAAARAGLAGAVAEAVDRRLAAAPGARLEARVPPATAPEIEARLGDRLTVVADPALEAAEAAIRWDEGGADVVPGACAEAALAAVRAHFAPSGDALPQVRKELADVG